MSKIFLCPYCQSKTLISDFENHYLNVCSGKSIIHQCQIGNCMQLFTTLDALHQHGKDAHSDTNFFDEAYVVVNAQLANSLCYEISNPPRTELDKLRTEDHYIGTNKKDNAKPTLSKLVSQAMSRTNGKIPSTRQGFFKKQTNKPVSLPISYIEYLKNMTKKEFTNEDILQIENNNKKVMCDEVLPKSLSHDDNNVQMDHTPTDPYEPTHKPILIPVEKVERRIPKILKVENCATSINFIKDTNRQHVKSYSDVIVNGIEKGDSSFDFTEDQSENLYGDGEPVSEKLGENVLYSGLFEKQRQELSATSVEIFNVQPSPPSGSSFGSSTEKPSERCEKKLNIETKGICKMCENNTFYNACRKRKISARVV